MDLERVVSVRGSNGPGSGYVVGGRLILTSAHVTGSVGSRVQVFRPGRKPVFGAMVRWRGTPGGRDDAALVEIDDSAWVAPAGAPVLWGRTVTNRPGIPCETWGLPDVAQVPGRPAELAQPSGTLNPGSDYVANRYVMSVDGQPPEPLPNGDSPWGGLSGAGLFCGDLLAGVVAADPNGWRHGKLAVVPAYVLHHDPGFRAVLAEHRALAALEAVEWQALAEPRLPPDPGGVIPSPSALLVARRAIVPFRGREDLLRELTEWADGPGISARLVHASGGQGKTRLAHEFASRLTAAGWSTLWLAAKPTAPDRIAELAAAARPLLVVLDFAETRNAQLAVLLDACARHSAATPIRILLLARTAGSWWTTAQSISPTAESLLDGAVATELPSLEPDADGQLAAYRDAAMAFAAVLPQVRGQSQKPWPQLAAHLTAVSFAPGPVGALTLHMTALADLLDSAQTAEGGGAAGTETQPGAVEDRLIKQERYYWDAAAEAQRITDFLTATAREDALAAIVGFGARTEQDADTLLAKIPGIAADRCRATREWIASLYPPTDAALPFGTLQPSRLAERFLGQHLAAHPLLPDALLPGADPAQAEQLLTVYTGAAAHPAFHGTLDESLTSLCTRHPDALAEPAIDVATRMERPGPLLNALQQIADDPDVSLDDIDRWVDHLPNSTTALADCSAYLVARLVREYRSRALYNPDEFAPKLASSLCLLSNCLGVLRHTDEALAAAGEAVEIYRQLAAAQPDDFLVALALSLDDLATELGNLGRQEEGLAAVNEAIKIYRRLAAAQPDALLRELAISLNTLANRLGDLGRRKEGLAAVSEAVEIYRRLAAVQPDEFQSGLATSLNILAIRLGDLGRREEGLAAVSEAVEICRQLAASQPDAFLSALPLSLHNLAIWCGDLGRGEEALAAISEAIEIYRRLESRRPDAFLPELASSLNVLATQLGNLERQEEGLPAVGEAVEIYRRLNRDRPEAFLPELASSLHTQGDWLGILERWEEAVAAASEAAAIYWRLAAAQPEAFLPQLGAVLHRLAFWLWEVLERREEGLATLRSAVEIYRRLAAAQPAEPLPGLALGLHNLAIWLGELGHQDDLLAVVSEAVELYRRLAAARPEDSLAKRALAHDRLANEYFQQGRREEQVAAADEALECYRQLARAMQEGDDSSR